MSRPCGRVNVICQTGVGFLQELCRRFDCIFCGLNSLPAIEYHSDLLWFNISDIISLSKQQSLDIRCNVIDVSSPPSLHDCDRRQRGAEFPTTDEARLISLKADITEALSRSSSVPVMHSLSVLSSISFVHVTKV